MVFCVHAIIRIYGKKIRMTQASNISALNDVKRALSQFSLAGTLGWQDIKQRYRRSKLGAFWLTISMAVLIGALGLVFGGVFNTPMQEILPFLALGIILWTFISSAIIEGCTAFISAEAIIKQLPLPLFVHVMRVLWRNVIILSHNIIIVPLIFLFFLKPLSLVSFLVIPGLLLSIIIIAWIAF
jgi:lipopolysaccharide transport system permease protein